MRDALRLQPRSDAQTAQDYFLQALSQFEAMQARPDVERARMALNALADGGVDSGRAANRL